MRRILPISVVLFAVLLTSASAAQNSLDPTVAQFLDGLAALRQAPLHERSPADVRDMLERLQSIPIDEAQAIVETRFIDGGPSGRIRVHIVRPPQLPGNLPAVIYFHGGEWMMGSFQTHKRLVNAIANGVGAAVVFVEYFRTPEAQFPIAVEQGFAALQFIARHAADLGIDGNRIAVAGDGAGGTIATVASFMAKRQQGPAIRGQVLLYPITAANFNNDTYRAFSDGPWLTRDDMKWFWEFYMPDHAQRSSDYVAPLNATIDELRGLPRALIITAEHDMMRQEGEEYAGRLQNAGVRTTMKRYDGVIHDFMVLNVLAASLAAKAAIQQTVDELKSMLAD